MTESEWLTSADPQGMLAFLKGSSEASDRKLRLFAVACCRRIWDFLLDSRSREAVEVSERYADGMAFREELDGTWKAAMAAARVLGHAPAQAATSVADAGDPSSTTSSDAARAAGLPGTPAWEVMGTVEFRAERVAQADLLREIFGNPFTPSRPIARSLLAYDNGLVVRMATAIYDNRLLPSGGFDPVRLAVLCDALLDAGCPQDHELLLHLREPGPHARGCFVIDLLLDRG